MKSALQNMQYVNTNNALDIVGVLHGGWLGVLRGGRRSSWRGEDGYHPSRVYAWMTRRLHMRSEQQFTRRGQQRSWSIFTTQMKRRIYAAFCRTF